MFFNKIKTEINKFIKKINYINIIAFFLVIIWIFSFLIQSKTIKQSELTAQINISKNIETSIPKNSLDLLPIKTIRDASTEFNFLFSKFDLSIIKWKKVKTVFREWIKKYLIVYEIEWWLERYLDIKSAIKNSIIESKAKNTLVEVNNLWSFSFYYNDENREETIYLVSLIWWKVWCFEYPRNKHKEMKLFTSSVVENY